MLLADPGTWHTALEWFVAHRRERMWLVLTKGGLMIEGPALYEHVEETDDGQFGVVLNGLCFWIIEERVTSVWIDPEDDGLLLIADDLWLYLQPKP